MENAQFLFASWYQRVHFLLNLLIVDVGLDQINIPVVIVVRWNGCRVRSPAVPYSVWEVDYQPCNDLDYLHLSILTVMSAAVFCVYSSRPRSLSSDVTGCHLPIAIQARNLAQVSISRLAIRYTLRRIEMQGTKGTPGTWQEGWYFAARYVSQGWSSL